jgi:hypothetical protein
LNSGSLAVFDLDGTITRRDTFGPFLWGFLWRRPWRLPRVLLALPGAARYLFNRDRGAFKGAVIHALLGGAQAWSAGPSASLPDCSITACTARRSTRSQCIARAAIACC